MNLTYRARDFVETSEGLAFALVLDGSSSDDLIATLRYRRNESGWVKLSTREAMEYLQVNRPDLLVHDPRFDCVVTRIPAGEILLHHRPENKLRERVEQAKLDSTPSRCRLTGILIQVAECLIESGIELGDLGVTGSYLLDAPNADSDLDLVIRSRHSFQRAREAFMRAIEEGIAQEPTESQWAQAWLKRAPSLTLDEFIWHQRRKGVNGWWDGVKVDLSLACPSRIPVTATKRGRVTVRVRITDDQFAFDYPAVWQCAGGAVSELLTYSATYAGQVRSGEWAEARGMLEETNDGAMRLVIGSDREAQGDWLRVLGEQR